MPLSIKFFTKLVGILVLLTTLVGCSQEKDEAAPLPDPMRCETMGYPCTWGGVDEDVLRRTWELGQEGSALFFGGKEAAEVRRWLEGQAGMAEVAESSRSIAFRLENGRMAWIIDGSERAGRGVESATNLLLERRQGSLTTEDVVKRDRDDPEPKTALVLSPFQWEFGEWDEGRKVQAMLLATRGYDAVTYLENGAVNVGAFRGWDAYDVIHVATHNTRICPEGLDCIMNLVSGIETTEPLALLHSDSSIAESAGININFMEDGQSPDHPTRTFLGLNSDFFRSHYPNGLDNTFIFLNACNSLEGPELASALIGESSHLFGWSDVVENDHASKTALAVFEELATNGFDTTAAREKVEELGLDVNAFNSARQNRAIRSEFRTSGTATLRVREMVRLIDRTTGVELHDGGRLELSGSVPGDDLADRVRLRARIDGLKDADYRLVFLVDGDPVGSDFIMDPTDAETTQVDESTWDFELEVGLPFDLPEDGKSVDIEAMIDLPGGGESRHVVRNVTIGGKSCPADPCSFTMSLTTDINWCERNAPNTPDCEELHDGTESGTRANITKRGDDRSVLDLTVTDPEGSGGPRSLRIGFDALDEAGDYGIRSSGPVRAPDASTDGAKVALVTTAGGAELFNTGDMDWGPACSSPITLHLSHVSAACVIGTVRGEVYAPGSTLNRCDDGNGLYTGSFSASFVASTEDTSRCD
ncbi:MAG: hypothetical protein ACNA8W_17930 [Bradymonadaceae bacterium]